MLESVTARGVCNMSIASIRGRTRRRCLPALVALAVFFPVTAAAAEPAGTTGSGTGGVTAGTPAPPTGGVQDGTSPADEPKRDKQKRRRAKPPVITKYSLGASALFDEGRALPVRFRVRAPGKQVHVWVVVTKRGGQRVGSVDLGLRPSGRTLEVKLGADRLGIGEEGSYLVRLAVRDRRGRRAARASGVATRIAISYARHRFPVAGQFSWGGADSRFGAPRSGHRHQGQDLSAAEGTPIVAPHAGVVTWVSYQAQGAGHYLVLDSEGEDRDYVFMHLKAGSINVRAGQRVPTGKLLARVGNTGRSFGAHLHFEVWSSGHWQAGGRPIDPLPLLQAWFKVAPGGAHTLDAPPVEDNAQQVQPG
jgi:murein DD-endopeptidase MepM/ murein hydrolase activator NlpD